MQSSASSVEIAELNGVTWSKMQGLLHVKILIHHLFIFLEYAVDPSDNETNRHARFDYKGILGEQGFQKLWAKWPDSDGFHWGLNIRGDSKHGLNMYASLT